MKMQRRRIRYGSSVDFFILLFLFLCGVSLVEATSLECVPVKNKLRGSKKVVCSPRVSMTGDFTDVFLPVEPIYYPWRGFLLERPTYRKMDTKVFTHK